MIVFTIERFEATNRVTRSRQKDRQHNGQKKKDKRTNNDIQNATQKTNPTKHPE